MVFVDVVEGADNLAVTGFKERRSSKRKCSGDGERKDVGPPQQYSDAMCTAKEGDARLTTVETSYLTRGEIIKLHAIGVT